MPAVGEAVAAIVPAVVWIEVRVVVGAVAEAPTERRNVTDAVRPCVICANIDALCSSTLNRNQHSVIERRSVRVVQIHEAVKRSSSRIEQCQWPAGLHVLSG